MSQSSSNICRLYRWANDRIFASLLHSVQRAADSPEPDAERYPLDAKILNCRVQLTTPSVGWGAGDAFTIEIAGSIYAACDNDYASMDIRIMDVTDGLQEFEIRNSKFEIPARAGVFCYHAELGRLPNKVTTLSDWTAVAHINLDWLSFPYKGTRVLKFSISILSDQSEQELASADCLFTYKNPAFGYIDLQENVHRTRSLAIALAFSVSAADNKLYHAEVQLIRDWAKANLLQNSKLTPAPVLRQEDAGAKLNTALDHAVSFFQKGNQLDVYKICKEIVEIAAVRDRYDILDLCLQVARAKGSVSAEELAILKDMASWLEVDMDRFHAMMEKALPVNIHQIQDVEVVLGLTPDMSREMSRRQLNKQYGKWNSRVTNADPEIQAQADQMLRLIAEARSQYVG